MAIFANICAFQLSVRRERQNVQQSKEIKYLKDECNALKKDSQTWKRELNPETLRKNGN